MRAVRFHHLVDSGGQRPLAALPSVIVEGASDRHHFIDHSFSAVAKFVPQNPQSLHRREGMFHRDTFARQQTVKITALPVQSTTVASLPRGDRARWPGFQSFETAVTQQGDRLGQAQSRFLRHFLIMPPGWHRGRTPQYFVPPDNDHILDRVPFLSPAIKALLFSPMLGTRQPSLRPIDDDLPQRRLFGQHLGQLPGLAGRSMQGNQLTDCGCQLPNPLTDLTLGNTKEQAHYILSRIRFIVQKDEKQLLLSTHQAALSSAARLTLTRSPCCGFGRSHRRPHYVKTPGHVLEFKHRQTGGRSHQPIRTLACSSEIMAAYLPQNRHYYQSPLLYTSQGAQVVYNNPLSFD